MGEAERAAHESIARIVDAHADSPFVPVPMTVHRSATLAAATLLALLSHNAVAAAQQRIDVGATVTLTTASPVYLLPDRGRVPLRTLALGTIGVVDRVQPEWVRITFDDPQFGRRTGWVESKFVRVTSPQTMPPPAPPPGPRVAPGTKPGQPARPTAVRGRRVAPTGRLLGTVAFDRMTATESFKAITGSDALPSVGVGAQGINVWRQLFVEGAVEYAWANGERAFVFDGEVFPLGIPVKLRLVPIDLVAGWRFAVGRVAPLVGGGLTVLRYEETSEFSDPAEDVKKWHPGFTALAGVEIQLSPQVHLRPEIRYRAYNGALGSGGVSSPLNESVLGGVGAAIKIVLGR